MKFDQQRYFWPNQIGAQGKQERNNHRKCVGVKLIKFLICIFSVNALNSAENGHLFSFLLKFLANKWMKSLHPHRSNIAFDNPCSLVRCQCNYIITVLISFGSSMSSAFDISLFIIFQSCFRFSVLYLHMRLSMEQFQKSYSSRIEIAKIK